MALTDVGGSSGGGRPTPTAAGSGAVDVVDSATTEGATGPESGVGMAVKSGTALEAGAARVSADVVNTKGVVGMGADRCCG